MKLLTTGLTLLSLACTQAIAAVGTPGFTSESQSYSYVTVDTQGTGSYKKLVQRNEQIDINIGWTLWTGAASNYEVYFDDTLMNSGSLTSGTTGNIEFSYAGKAGAYDLTLKFCDGGECKTSAVKELIIADTDGAHLAPLTMTTDARNKTYEKTDSVVAAYFVEWGVYGRDYDVSDLPADNLTHLIYGFIPVCGSNASLSGSPAQALTTACADSQDYEVVIHDPWAALQMSFDGVAYSDPIKGIYSQLMALKQRNPDLKILPSIGGWTLSDPLFGFTEKANRDVFVDSVEEFLRTWKFYDGVDIDWEFPGGDGANANLGDTVNDGPAYIALMKELRAMLDSLEAETGRTYELTSAIGAGADKIEDVDYAEAQTYMDYIFAMTYDFYGAWSNVTGHQTALHCGSSMSTEQCAGTGEFEYPAYTTDAGIQALLAQGVEPGKIVVGAAMYGRSWIGAMPADAVNDDPMTITNAAGALTGSTSQGIWEAGVIDYKGIYANMIGDSGTGINGWEVGYDEVAEAAYVWNRSTGGLISYDSPRSVKAKGEYVKSLGLGGLFAWEIDADNGDILNAMRESLPAGTSETTPEEETNTTPEEETAPEQENETTPEEETEPEPEPEQETEPEENNETEQEPTNTEGNEQPTESTSANAYSAGTTYSAGDVVSNDGKLYECLQAGWCSQGGAYELGTDAGWASEHAWKEIGDAITTDNGSTDNGSTDNGSTDNGSTDNGSTDNGSADNGSTDNGSTDNGSTDNGSTDNGSTDNGSTDNGSTDNGSTDSGSDESIDNSIEEEGETGTITITGSSGGSMGWFALPLLALAFQRKLKVNTK